MIKDYLKDFTRKQKAFLSIAAIGAVITVFGRTWLWAYALDYTKDRETGVIALAVGIPVIIVSSAILIWDIRSIFRGLDFSDKKEPRS